MFFEESCPACDFQADEIDALRTLLGREVSVQRWKGHNMAVEFSRIVVPANGENPYVYIHAEKAWGETDAEFEARYKRLRKFESKRLNTALHKVYEARVRPDMADVV